MATIRLFPQEGSDNYLADGIFLLREFIFSCDPFWLSRTTKESFLQGIYHELDFLISGIYPIDFYKDYIKLHIDELYEEARKRHGLTDEPITKRPSKKLLSEDR